MAPQIGVPRIIELCKELGVKHTFFVPGWCAEQYPEAIELMVKNGHEVALHGYRHEYPNLLTREQEYFWTKKGADAITKIAGKRPVGYPCPLVSLFEALYGYPRKGRIPLGYVANGR